MKHLVLYIFIILTLLSCGNNYKKDKSLNVKNDTFFVESRDSLPIKKYWEFVKDTLKFSLTEKNEYIALDKSKDFKIVKGHFTSKDKYECLLQSSFINWKGGKFDLACIFSFENKLWKLENYFNVDSLYLVDFNKDSILDFFYFEDWVGNGSVDREYRLVSLKNNEKKIIFEDTDNHDNLNNSCAFSIAKNNDTVYKWSIYSFVDKDKSKPLILNSTINIGVKKGVTKDNTKLIVSYSKTKKVYIFDELIYK